MKRILIIEDDTSIAELEREYMEINGFSTDIENNGETGLHKAQSTDYDLIILDLMLPRVDGFEICRQLRIDKLSHRVYINEIEINLTVKEFDLLVLLASYPNRVFSKNELFERIWGLDSLGDSATVTVHIGKIRDKIELVPSNP
ncbi:MAG: response regulator transcription factor [Bacillota bacterium]|nr:response regulator transcription factor [Bacillota bacterium]